ncbi:hypothetical protein LCGC14_0199050 [marine sediment metagenome]|uniref:Putative beta-lactamase-inhibitor-like PepSY-like domain-containing protein n=1 Tax=marine sediment metagenome TaxID=412755 RepID=A0A0F9UJ77_9ZZZZ|nr:PepSY-like domain-containing protein [Maribacter sp.]HDZ03921.1 hypothetical protein [Maribacter sp.]
MKQGILIAVLLLFFSCEDTIVPRSVQIKFLELEPSALKINWTIDDEIYQVDCLINSKKSTSYFDKSGNWLETESEIDSEELPEAILKTLRTKMGEYSIVDIELVKTKENQVLYEVDLKKENKFYDILFNESGKILRKKI